MDLDYLAKLYPHARDANINFDAGPHTYTINGEEKAYHENGQLFQIVFYIDDKIN